MIRASLDDLAQSAPNRLRRAALKLTHVGEQTEPVLTVLIHTYTWLPSLEDFTGVSSPGVSYDNDRLPTLLCISAAHAEFAELLTVARPVISDADNGPAAVSFSVLLDAADERAGNEWLLSEESGSRLVQEFYSVLRADNGIGREALFAYCGRFSIP